MTSGSQLEAASAPVSSALRRHGLAVVAAALLVGMLVGWVGHRQSGEQAEQAARHQVGDTARDLSLLLATRDLAQNVDWRVQLAAMLRPRMNEGAVVAVHVWHAVDAERGEIVWSSEATRVGQRRPLGGVGVALEHGEPHVERIADGRESEGPALANLYEVYHPFADAAGDEYVVEVYEQVPERDELRATILVAWLPVSLGGVVLLGLMTLPLSVRLARRVSRAEAQRSAWALRALRARSDERVHLAEELHERTVQDIATARLLLESLPPAELSPVVEAGVTRAADILGVELAELRLLLVSGEGGTLRAQHLGPALARWVDGVAGDIAVQLDLPSAPIDLAEAGAATLFGVLKEAVRNALKHAHSREVLVRVHRDGEDLVGQVVDDGRGLAGAGPGLGLAIIAHAVGEQGGHWSLEDASGSSGAVFTVRLPAVGHDD